jgi:chemotaxis protein MotB
VLALVMTPAALGLGYLTWQLWTAQQATTSQLSTAKAQVQTLTEERARHVAALSDLQKQTEADKQKLEANATQISDLKSDLGAAQSRLEELKAQSQELNARVAEFRGVTRQFQRMIDSGKLQINFRRGRMIVELPAAVLFASGSAALSEDGRKSLQEVAKILRTVPGKHFIVGGHTDDVPIAKAPGGFSSNWALSAARAVTVTETLIDSGLHANQLVATGYGEYDPIASNGSDKGRQKNRRIEIVLEPILTGLPNALADLEKQTAKAAAAKAAAAKPAAKAAK